MAAESKNNNGLKAIVGILGVALAGILFYAYTLYSDNQDSKSRVKEEQAMVLEELNNIKADYDRELQSNKRASKDLVRARDLIVKYMDSVKVLNADMQALYRFRAQVRTLVKEREKLIKQNKSLRRSNRRLTVERDSTVLVLEQQSVFTDSLIVQNTELAKAVEAGASLNLASMNIDAVKVRNNGKMVSTDNAKRADKIQVCYTVGGNKLAKSGAKQFYVQLIAPNGSIMGERAVAANAEEGTNITYSKPSSFFYENTPLDVCVFINKPGSDFGKGNYEVKVFDEKLIELGSTKFALN
ncbi:hypothetical protein [Abyssalbus ytuae]|uniref:Chromosome partitioning protein ParA n=1 Tax=Abyssalbus ytuae TaxID=2926907 RepID=A0A9E6ZY56_9FLAO|nr:hypothetical protein [Abyssalbus ytuae]UOB17347.1 hypothetical protein MQE35_16620 [Abyssalbus ytuae]